MPPEPVDHEIKLRVRASEWLALRAAARDDDRPLSNFCRKVLLDYLCQVSARERELAGDDEG